MNIAQISLAHTPESERAELGFLSTTKRYRQHIKRKSTTRLVQCLTVKKNTGEIKTSKLNSLFKLFALFIFI
jgi:hypothetical protein